MLHMPDCAGRIDDYFVARFRHRTLDRMALQARMG